MADEIAVFSCVVRSSYGAIVLGKLKILLIRISIIVLVCCNCLTYEQSLGKEGLSKFGIASLTQVLPLDEYCKWPDQYDKNFAEWKIQADVDFSGGAEVH